MPDYFKNSHEWRDFDRDHLWHPYTSMKDPLPCYPVTGTHQNLIHLADGTELIDGMSSWWSALHGYNHPTLMRALTNQAAKFPHVMFGGISHQPASELGKRLIEISPKPFQHVFLADSGSISIEVALKMALQYWQSCGRVKKQALLTIRGGYHGDPFTCMSVSDPVNSGHHLFPKAIAKHYFAQRPKSRFDGDFDPYDLIEVKTILEQHSEDIAAIIVEPIVQGAGGMWFYHPEYLNGLRKLCDEYETLLIFDEIATGFGRTGKLFAIDHTQILPDIFCVGKALTGGVMTLAATITTTHVAMTISNGEVPVLMHGPTFMGNALACAVACASIDVLLGHEDNTYPQGWSKAVSDLNERMQKLKTIKSHKAVADVRTLGGIGVVEMHAPVDVPGLQAEFVKSGIWVRPFGKLIYIMPPYTTPEEHVEHLCDGIIATIRKSY